MCFKKFFFCAKTGKNRFSHGFEGLKFLVIQSKDQKKRSSFVKVDLLSASKMVLGSKMLNPPGLNKSFYSSFAFTISAFTATRKNSWKHYLKIPLKTLKTFGWSTIFKVFLRACPRSIRPSLDFEKMRFQQKKLFL